MEITHEYVSGEINKLLSKYDFPIYALQDVSKRLGDSDDPNYAAQQLRYLQNLVGAGYAKMKSK